MKDLRRDIESMQRQIDDLSKRTQKMIEGLGDLEEAVDATRKGKSLREEAVRRIRTGSETAIDRVYEVIKRSRGAVSTDKIRDETGFDDKKIWDIVNRLKRQGRVKSQRRGSYTNT